MATQALITPEQYLATHYDWEPELVRGEIVERPLPTKRHARAQQRLSVLLDRAGYCYPELRMRLEHDTYRVPDIAVFDREPEGEVPATPPRLVVEVSSPDDTIHNLLAKFEQYRAWGVAHIWLVEPELKHLYVYSESLIKVDRFEIGDVTITPAELFA